MNPFTAIFNLITTPFGVLMNALYGLFNNYALAIFFFALVVKVVLIPLGIQQQKSQIKMAKIKPKEQAIRGKYAGRTDSKTQQVMQTEIMEMYKTENYSAFSGCLPLLFQLPILFALYSIIRNPLTYISRLSAPVIDSVKEYIVANSELFTDYIKNLTPEMKIQNIQEIDIIKIFNTDLFASVQSNVEGLADYIPVNFGFFGQVLTSSPAEAGFSILLIIPVLNFAASFLQMRLTKIINAGTAAGDMANNKGMKFMEYSMPLLIVWMSYTWYSALGMYWIFQSVLGVGQTLLLAKIMPIPKISEEEYELARQQYGVVKKKKKKKPAVTASEEESEDGETERVRLPDIDSLDSSKYELKDEKYISKTIPKGINQNAKKSGKKYNFKRKK